MKMSETKAQGIRERRDDEEPLTLRDQYGHYEAVCQVDVNGRIKLTPEEWEAVQAMRRNTRPADTQLAETQAENERLRGLLRKSWELLFIARRAAAKLNTMYTRGEISPRAELDELIENKETMMDLFLEMREALATTQAAGGGEQ